jgi:hypothetical protein
VGRRLAQWQMWVTVAAALAPVLVVVDLGLFERNRALQVEVANRQQFLQQTVQLDNLQRDLVNAIAALAARSNDLALRAILVDHGMMAPPPGPQAPAAPPSGR